MLKFDEYITEAHGINNDVKEITKFIINELKIGRASCRERV
jgi:hypothetical protein